MMKSMIGKLRVLLFMFALPNLFPMDTVIRMDQYLTKVLSETPIPGFSVAAVDQSGILFSHGYGLEVAGTDRIMTSQSITSIGSIAKSFTALAVMQTVEEGLLDLDTPVVEYLPWFCTADKTLSDRITLRMLLSNTSGLPLLNRQKFSSTGSIPQQMRDSAEELETVVMHHEPGASFEYSNEGFMIAALCLSKVTGMNYREYMEERIFTPLGMTRSVVDPGEVDSEKFLTGHSRGINSCSPLKEVPIVNMSLIPAGSCFYSSSDDMARYMEMLLNGGTIGIWDLIDKKSLQEMWTPRINAPGLSIEMGGDDSDIGYGLGWIISEIEGRRIVFHGGDVISMTAVVMLEPDTRRGVILMSNTGLLDPYTYPSLMNITNNILRIMAGEEPDDFGRPVVEPPTGNGYPLEFSERYYGDYLPAYSRGTELYHQFSIAEGHRGFPILKGYMNREILLEAELDFLNPGTAVNHNIMEPRPVSFQILPDGRVLSMNYDGTEYLKGGEIPEDYSEHAVKGFSIFLPESWNPVGENAFKAPDGSTTIYCSSEDSTFGMDEFRSRYFNDASFVFLRSESGILSGTEYYEEIFRSTGEDHLMIFRLECNTAAGKLLFLLVVEEHQATSMVKKVMIPLLRNLRMAPDD